MTQGAVIVFAFFLFATPQSPGPSLTAVVYDPQGFVVANAQIRLSFGGAQLRAASTDGEGRCQFHNLGPGSYLLKTCAAGFQCEESSLQLSDAGASTVEIRLKLAGIHQGVVVSATRQETETSETTLASAVITSRRMDEQITLNLAQALEAVPGVNWINAGAFRSRPVVRGLDSNRVLILVDGERLNNARTSTTNTGIEPSLVDLSHISQVEIVSGPGSVLYGSDALGGVLNIRTRTAAPGDTLHLGARLRNEFFPNSDGRRTSLDLSASRDWWAIRAAGSLGNINDYRSPAGRLYDSGVDESSALIDLRVSPTLQQTLFLKFVHRGAYDFGVPSLEPNPVFLARFPFTKLQKFSAGYNGSYRFPWFSALQVRAYRQEQPRDFVTDLTAPDNSHVLSDGLTRVRSIGIDAQVSAVVGQRHQLTYGVSSYRDHHREKRLQLLQSNGISTVLTRAPSVPDSAFSNTGLFIQDEFHWNRRLRVQGGIRTDRFRLNASKTADYDPAAFTVIEESRADTAWSGNLGSSITINANWTAAAHLARAFREPNLFERYFFGRGSLGNFFVPNPDLKPETSAQLDLGTRFQRGPLHASLNYFVNELENLITTVPGTFQGLSVRRGEPIRQNVNIDRARIQGFESSTDISLRGLRSQWTAGISGAWQRGTNQTTGRPLPLIAPFTAQARLRLAPRGIRFWSEWQSRLAKGSDRVAAGENPISGYTVFSWRAGYEFPSITLNVGIENLSNRLYRGLFETVPQPGREFRFALDLRLDHGER